MKNIPLGLASRTHAPDVAREMLKMLHIIPSFSATPNSANAKPLRALDYFDQMQIFPGSKVTHFTKIHHATGLKYDDMLFFDDEARNREVEAKLGVTFCLVRDGVTKEEVDRGIWAWRKTKGITPLSERTELQG